MPYSVENIVRKGEIASHNVFHRYISLVRQNAVLYGKRLSLPSAFNCFQTGLVYINCFQIGLVYINCFQTGLVYINCFQTGLVHINCFQTGLVYINCFQTGLVYINCFQTGLVYINCFQTGLVYINCFQTGLVYNYSFRCVKKFQKKICPLPLASTQNAFANVLCLTITVKMVLHVTSFSGENLSP